MTFIPGLTYTLSFDAWNRSEYVQDNIINITVPGRIVSVVGDLPFSASDIELFIDTAASQNRNVWENVYSCTSISTSSITFSTGGSLYRVYDSEGGYIDHECASPFGVSSITFVATSSSGSVSFSDVSSDVIPGYGPLLDNISMNQEYLYVDIDVDSNNDGVINAFDDPIEMGNSQSTSIESGAYGYTALVGEEFTVNISTISSIQLDSSEFDVRFIDSAGILNISEAFLQQPYATITAEQTCKSL